ncbi:hypothetical protein VCR19J5_230480 [Vibrio crassostreae]|nr:hypothetical protein VCR19J5_230480 [Vibrio crassostreae]
MAGRLYGNDWLFSLLVGNQRQKADGYGVGF